MLKASVLEPQVKMSFFPYNRSFSISHFILRGMFVGSIFSDATNLTPVFAGSVSTWSTLTAPHCVSKQRGKSTNRYTEDNREGIVFKISFEDTALLVAFLSLKFIILLVLSKYGALGRVLTFWGHNMPNCLQRVKKLTRYICFGFQLPSAWSCTCTDHQLAGTDCSLARTLLVPEQ